MPNYDVNYDDKRFTEVEKDKQQALSDVENTYGGMINQTDKFYQDQINASKQWAETQKQNQQAQTDFAIQEINQQKEQAQKDYTKEQSGAYVDWQEQSNPYGANAEAMAQNGMANGGYSESSQVAMYNQYQQRVASARESYNRAVLNYDNAITEARLQNNAVLAEIAYTALQQQLELSLAGFQYKNTLILEKTNQKQNVENNYYNRWKDVLNQINQENALAEDVRQYNESLAEEKRQYNETIAEQQRQHAEEMAYKEAALAEEKRQYDSTLAWQKEQAAKSSSGGSSSISKGSSSGSSSNNGSSSISKNSSSSSSSSNKSSEPTVDMDSVLALGYGPISATKLNQLVKEGKVVEIEKNGKLYYTKKFNY